MKYIIHVRSYDDQLGIIVFKYLFILSCIYYYFLHVLYGGTTLLKCSLVYKLSHDIIRNIAHDSNSQ